VVCLAGGLHQHFFLGTARWWERVLLIVAALVLIKPGAISDLAGLILIALTLASQRWVHARPLRSDRLAEIPTRDAAGKGGS